MGAKSKAIAASLTSQIETAVKALVLEITANLIKATPVDTGWARANWVPALGSPYADTTTQPVKHGVADTGAQQQGQADVLRFTLADVAAFVSNHVPYIEVLNYGHSQQAPAGFIELALALAIQTTEAKLRNKGSAVSLGTRVQDELAGQLAGNVASAYSPLGAA